MCLLCEAVGGIGGRRSSCVRKVLAGVKNRGIIRETEVSVLFVFSIVSGLWQFPGWTRSVARAIAGRAKQRGHNGTAAGISCVFRLSPGGAASEIGGELHFFRSAKRDASCFLKRWHRLGRETLFGDDPNVKKSDGAQ